MARLSLGRNCVAPNLFRLDRQAPVARPKHPIGATVANRDGTGKLAGILIAEDDKSVREFVTRALREDGHAVSTVDSGTHALDAINAARFDLLLSDIRMPGMDGIALALKISNDYPSLPIVLMTGYASERQRAYNLSALILGVIEKPFTLKQIRAAASRALSAG